MTEFVRNGLIDLTACRGHCRSDKMDRPTEQGVVKYISWDISSTRHSVLTIGDNRLIVSIMGKFLFFLVRTHSILVTDTTTYERCL